MDDTPLRKRPWFYIAAWLVILLVVYAWQIFLLGGVINDIRDVIIDLFCVFPAFLVFWLVFFSQFVLPVRTFRDRQKIFDRLIIYLLPYLFGRHGPAMFIRDGVLIKKEGEERKKGPGVLWLDSASAAVTRTATKIKQTLGPGVHFTEKNEYIAGTVDLHIQTDPLGPKEADKPFETFDERKKNLEMPLDEKKEAEEEATYKAVQDRRKQVSAWTRDGIEVVPNITIIFRVDTGFPKENQPGSRFGFRTGPTKKDKENEAQDKEAIRKAILGEGINPNIKRDSPRHRVAWNQLPAILAVDVWREYASKFTRDELFKAEQPVPPAPPQLPAPTEEEIDPLTQPIIIGTERSALERIFAQWLRTINIQMNHMIKWLEKKEGDKTKKPATPQPPAIPPASVKNEPQKKTGLQVITDMVKARLTQAEVDIISDTGQRGIGAVSSAEFKLLKDRGLKIINVSISNPQFNPAVEESLIRAWNANWYDNAKAESNQIDRQRNNLEKTAEEQAKRQHTEEVSRQVNDLFKTGKPDIKEMLKALILHSHTQIQSREQLRRRMITETQDIEEMIKWIEANGK
jgi:hypothetical protein